MILSPVCLAALALLASGAQASKLDERAVRLHRHHKHKHHHKTVASVEHVAAAAKLPTQEKYAGLSPPASSPASQRNGLQAPKGSSRGGLKPAPSGSRNGLQPPPKGASPSASPSSVAPGPSPTPVSGGMKVATSYVGNAFLDTSQWDYFSDSDPTHGIVNYLSQPQAVSANLSYVKANGNFVMAVDSTHNYAQGQGRPSVRIASKATMTQGQLVVFDVVHMPVGCGSWPAGWLLGTGKQWPNGGEVDIIEGVTNSQSNQMTLHSPMQATGNVVGSNCDVAATGNSGCGVTDKNTATWGQAFNNGGGGVWATLWSDFGWQIWSFPRNNIPSDLAAGAPKPSTWGEPAGAWAQSACAASFFTPQQIIWDITLCGDWAGAVYGQSGCPGTCQSQVATGSNFQQAYWELASVKIYE